VSLSILESARFQTLNPNLNASITPDEGTQLLLDHGRVISKVERLMFLPFPIYLLRVQVFSWGINDNAALGRRTDREYPEIAAEVYETEPMQVEGFSPSGEGILGGPKPSGGKTGEVDKFRATRIAAGDSVSVAVSDEGEVRVWGSFRVS